MNTSKDAFFVGTQTPRETVLKPANYLLISVFSIFMMMLLIAAPFMAALIFRAWN